MCLARRSKPPKWVIDAMPKRCCKCGSTKNIVYDHIKPVVLGNETWTIENTRPVCNLCHRREVHGQVLVGQMEMLSNHSFLVREGIRKANERGVKNGRKGKNPETVLMIIAENSSQFNDVYDSDYELKTEREVMQMVGLKSVSAYEKYKKMLVEAMKADVWPYAFNKPKYLSNRPMYEHQIKRMREAEARRGC